MYFPYNNSHNYVNIHKNYNCHYKNIYLIKILFKKLQLLVSLTFCWFYIFHTKAFFKLQWFIKKYIRCLLKPEDVKSEYVCIWILIIY